MLECGDRGEARSRENYARVVGGGIIVSLG